MSEKELNNKISAFLTSHIHHEGYYRWALSRAEVLTVFAASFKNTVNRLIEARVDCLNSGPRSEAGNDDSARLNPNEACSLACPELEALVSVIQTLTGLSGNISSYPLRDDLKEIGPLIFDLPFDDPINNELFITLFGILNDQEEALRHMLQTSRLLVKAISLFENTDLSLSCVRKDLTKNRIIPRLMLIASSLVSDAATTARAGADLIRHNRSRWKELQEKAQQLGIITQENEQQNMTGRGCKEKHIELNELSNIIEAWIEKNFAGARVQFVEGKHCCRPNRVKQLSKAWWSDDIIVVDALIEYEGVDEEKDRTASFQVDNKGIVIGFNFFESIRG